MKGEILLKIARDSIQNSFDGKPIDSLENKSFNDKKGVFVTLYLDGELRGCIGFTKTEFPLWKAVAEAARLAAFDDQRFLPLSKEEFQNVSIEISVLTEPKEIKIKNPDKDIEIGKDGLIVECSGRSGLLLPQVANEFNWKAEKFLEQTCVKAGMTPKSWKSKCKIFKFQCEIFSEK